MPPRCVLRNKEGFFVFLGNGVFGQVYKFSFWESIFNYLQEFYYKGNDFGLTGSIQNIKSYKKREKS